ncbi:glycerophosphodiester phosphodiesterase family protein [Marinilactibacillus kalidii]|uniref:glycerophosphodiester phosphodiesterase family protein n=1 Tax=Marinilactibacillus kalidii TaxID=2820274 RepID=UPI001ABED0BE|nr:glycerophosphodiester phosphodiesterase family protein [Marinilactibacillus kalidii]
MKDHSFLKANRSQPFLIMAHRGFWGGNIIENSIESSQLAYKAGADIVEVDVCRSADGVYYLFHNHAEQMLLSRSEPFEQLTSTEIDQISVNNSLGVESGYKLNKLTAFLDWLPENKLVNLDRSWGYWDDPIFFEILKQSGKQKQIVLKSPVQMAYLNQLAQQNDQWYYIPIVKDRKEIELVQSYEEIDMIGIELIVTNLDSNLLEETYIQALHDQHLLIVANAENLGARFNLFGGLTDDHGLLDDGIWRKFLSLGIDIIQTDWPNFLSDFRKQIRK